MCMLCPYCGRWTPDNQRFCQNCRAELNKNAIKTKKKSTKKLIIIISSLSFALLIVVCTILYVFAKTSLALMSSIEPPTTVTPTETFSIDYKSESLKEMTYCYNSKWEITKYDSGNVYNCDEGKLVLGCYTFNRKVNYTDVKDDVEIIEENNTGLTLSESPNINFDYDNIETYYFSATYTNDDGVDWYYDYYAFLQGDTIFTMIFNGKIANSKTEFDESKDYILQHIKFSEPATEEPTTVEPTTVEPTTEKPTDVTEPMTLLFENDEISVYFSDVEFHSYKNKAVDVHLFIDNKTDKQLKFSTETVILDGISYNDTACGDVISANTRGMIEIWTQRCTNISPSTVGTDLIYYPAGNIDDRVEVRIISQSVK